MTEERKESIIKILTDRIEEEANFNIKKYGIFKSPHEFYGVLNEEWEESSEGMAFLNDFVKFIWGKIRKKLSLSAEDMMNGRTYTLLVICELIEVASSFDKAMKSPKEDVE